MTSHPRRAALLAVLCTAIATPLLAQPTQVKPGFNIFSEQQDVEIGRQSAAQAERQLPMLNDRNVDSYVSQIVRRLASAAPGARYPYQIRVVNARDINAFSLPGGYMYVNRGLIEAARSEPELAGVLAHEMAHVALRHGTHQASKAYMTQAGIGILGGLIGRGRNPSQIFQAIGGLGLNALFLKFSRDDETQADVVGAQMMARAGYDPNAMADFFQVLQSRQRGQQSGLATFLSDHPSPANREARIRQEAQRIGAVRESREVGGFAQVQSQLRGRGRAASMEDIARRQSSRNASRTQRYPLVSDARYGTVGRIESPSSRLATYRQRDGFFSIQYPDNWRASEPDNGFGVTIVPEGGVVEGDDGEQSILYGAIVNHYDPFESRNTVAPTLDEASRDLIAQMRQSNAYLEPEGSPRRETIDGQSALSQVLSGRSPVTGEEERVTVFTRQLPDDHVIYAVFIAPGREYSTLAPLFSRMVRSLQVNDEVAHR